MTIRTHARQSRMRRYMLAKRRAYYQLAREQVELERRRPLRRSVIAVMSMYAMCVEPEPLEWRDDYVARLGDLAAELLGIAASSN